VYIISKGRWESRKTARALDAMGVPYRVAVEPQEYGQYAAVLPDTNLLVLPFSNLGQGSIPARNWVWNHAVHEGHARHWILDDNIRAFARLYQNTVVPVATGAIFRAMEDFVERYENVALAGPQYYAFARSNAKHDPFVLNTRIYSCILIKNDLPYRWRGRYNEDTDLSLRALKDGWCTALFYAFLMDKATTMTMPGGNTEELYKLSDGRDGRLLMAQSLQRQHPDVVRIARRWGRWQHVVDYRPFKRNRLVRRAEVEIFSCPNEYGMALREAKGAQNG